MSEIEIVIDVVTRFDDAYQRIAEDWEHAPFDWPKRIFDQQHMPTGGKNHDRNADDRAADASGIRDAA